MNPARIMIVEDESIVALDLKRSLLSLGYAVPALSSSGEDAVSKAIAARPDLILMDIKLGGRMDGVEATERIRTSLDVPVIYLTAYADESTLQRAKITQPYGYLLKPFEERELRSAIETAIYRYGIEGRLRESENRYRSLCETSPSAIALVDLAGNLLLGNSRAAAMHGYDRAAEMVGLSALDLLAPEDRHRACSSLRRLLDQGSARYTEYTFLRRDGSFFPGEVSVAQVLDRNGQPQSYTAAWTDLTERRAAEEALRQTQKLESIGLLAGGVAHDFNNLLTGVLAQASLALSLLPPDAPAGRHIAKAITSAEMATHLTRQLLAYAGKGQFQIETLCLDELVANARDLLETALPKLTKLNVILEAGPVVVRADPRQIEQVLLNLVINAAEAAGQGPAQVTVRTGVEMIPNRAPGYYVGKRVPEPGAYACLVVSDAGPGFASEEADRFFEPFFSTKGTGRGLGLAAVLGIMQRHRGAFRVWSRPGVGSTFCGLFPVAADDDLPAHRPADLPGPAGARKRFIAHPAGASARLVLVIDDEAPVREALTDILEMAGFQVITASDGQSGIDIFRSRRHEIALVVLDLSMPVMDGWQTLHGLRELAPETKVILSSGYDETEAANLHADPLGRAWPLTFLQKPYNIDTLFRKVQDALDGK